MISFLFLAASLQAPDTTLACAMVTKAEAERALGVPVVRLTRTEKEFEGSLCTYSALSGAVPHALVEVAVMRYSSVGVADSVYRTFSARNRHNPQVLWRAEREIGPKAFSEALLAGGRGSGWVQLVEGDRRMVLQLSGIPFPADSASARVRRLAREAAIRWRAARTATPTARAAPAPPARR